MTVTILDLLSRLPNIATEHRGELLNQENPYVTIITVYISRTTSAYRLRTQWQSRYLR